MKRYFIHNPFFRLLAPAVYGVFLYLLLLLINNNVGDVNRLFNSQELYVMIGLTYISFEICRLIVIAVNRLAPDSAEVRKNAIQVVTGTCISLVLVLGCLMIYFEKVVGFSISMTQLWIFAGLFAVTALMYNVLYLSNYYLQKENTLKLNSEKQQRQVLDLEMMEFRNDINPDLLYESLESLIGLMYKDVGKAEEYIDCLATTYRYVLVNRQKELVPVQEEILAAQSTVTLLNEKYHGMIRLTTQLDESDRTALLIPGSLPLVIESLVRNTIINQYDPFIIHCFSEDGYLTLQSRLNDRLQLHPASEHAFQRLQRSYALYSDMPLIRVKAYQENYIKLPMINVAEEMNKIA